MEQTLMPKTDWTFEPMAGSLLLDSEGLAEPVLTAMPKTGSAESTSGRAERLSVLVVYEETRSHERARRLCERVLNRFWDDLDFDFSWWSFDFLRDSTMARAAATAAGNAQLVLFSVRSRAGLPPVVQRWVQTWLGLRKGREGAVALLLDTPDPREAASTVTYLRFAAEQAQMDFLLEGMVEPASVVEEAAVPGSKPKGRVTAALRRILNPHQSPPPHWGINE